MKKKFWKKIGYALCVVLSIFTLAGCQNGEKEDDLVPESEVQEEDASSRDDVEQQEETSNRDSTEKQEDTQNQEDAPNQEDVKKEDTAESQFSFADISNLEFCFSSGAGGWRTVMYIHEDGTFEGNYQDSDMGDTGEGYPGGVAYFCDFNGKFTQPERVNAYTYMMEMEYIKMENQVGTEEIIDGVCYRYSDPYGLDSAKKFYIYVPGIPLQELPEEFRSWVGYYDLESTKDTRLPYYGLYNVTPQYGFSSYEATNTEVENTATDESAAGKSVPGSIDEELASIEAEAEVLENQLQSGLLTQIELNQTSAERYQLWDEELNSIWKRLKERLDENAMAALTEEERAWISYKENEIAAVGEEYGAGSMCALVENDRAAELTRERVYKLAELLR